MNAFIFPDPKYLNSRMMFKQYITYLLWATTWSLILLPIGEKNTCFVSTHYKFIENDKIEEGTLLDATNHSLDPPPPIIILENVVYILLKR